MIVKTDSSWNYYLLHILVDNHPISLTDINSVPPLHKSAHNPTILRNQNVSMNISSGLCGLWQCSFLALKCQQSTLYVHVFICKQCYAQNYHPFTVIVVSQCTFLIPICNNTVKFNLYRSRNTFKSSIIQVLLLMTPSHE